MVRITLSFILALFGHLLLLQQSLSRQEQVPPTLLSETSISISLNEAPIKKPEKQEPEKLPAPPPPQVKLKSATTPQPPKPVALKNVLKKKKVSPPKPVNTHEPEEIAKVVKESPEMVQSAQPTKNISKREQVKVPAQAVSATIEAKPLYQFNPKPEYPVFARRRGWQGIVNLRIEVTPDGEVATVHLLKSCGYKILDKSAIKAVKRWRFTPGTRNGKTILSTVIIPVHFKLSSNS